jgi:hypothetical protein
MEVLIKLRCSECEFVRETVLKSDDAEIICVNCGRRMANFEADEHREMVQQQSSQRTLSIVALVMFFLAVVFIILWAGNPGAWPSGKTVADSGEVVKATGIVEPNSSLFIGFCITALAAFVLSIVASTKRHVAEF